MLVSTAGSQLMIGSARPDWLAAVIGPSAFDGETWIEIGSTNTLGSIAGDWTTDQAILPDPNDPDSPPMPNVTKTVQPVRQMQIAVDLDGSDAGQLRMIEAEVSIDAHAFRIVLPGGAERLFVALVTAANDIFNEANTVVGIAFTLVLQSNVVRT